MQTYRIYFNRKAEHPRYWSIDEGTQETEVNIQGFRIDNCVVGSHVIAKAERGILDPNTVPFAWLTVNGRLRLEGGIAYFSHEGAEP
jgi:hypothetical protein